ncbi:hypothetical protein [Streptomyces specialis]|uniref:hypothetical protein n=1 Tax=Streptomyces specialis TaxID=498367 RepID=UPI00073E7108|nr:hypothetical protein [Streptomyces specialis]
MISGFRVFADQDEPLGTRLAEAAEAPGADAGRKGDFAPVRVNESLAPGFMTVEDPARLRAAGAPCGDDPADPGNGRAGHPLCRPGQLWRTDR